MANPLNHAALRAAANASPIAYPDWLKIGQRAYWKQQRINVKIFGILGHLVQIEAQGQILKVPLTELDAPTNREHSAFDLSAIAYHPYREIASQWQDVLNGLHILEATQASCAPLPDTMHPHLQLALRQISVTQFYSHQLTAWQELQQGRSIVLTTPTSSGKTWGFLPFIFHQALTGNRTALLLYPLRALASDQWEKLTALNHQLPPQSRLKIVRCTGDVPLEERKAYFQGTCCPDIIIASPDVLHHQLSRSNDHRVRLWQEFLQRIGIVVIDEAHSYISAFGIHFANLMRRLRLACFNVSHSHPSISWIISTATIANPKELAAQFSDLPHEQITLIAQSGAKSSERTLLVLKPQTSPNFTTVNLIADLIARGLQGLVFVNARSTAKQIYALVCRQLGSQAKEVALFYGSLTTAKRRELLARLKTQQLKAIITTSALEVGLDLPNLDFVVVRGMTSLNNLWQRFGRAGRSSPGLLILVPDAASHIDFYYASKSERLFEGVEQVKIQPNYPAILSRHILCAASEGGIPVNLVPQYFGVGSDRIAAELLKQQQLSWSSTQVLWTKGYPHRTVSLRGMAAQTVDIIDQSTGEVLEEMSQNLAHRECHPGAIYLTSEAGETLTWRCVDLDEDAQKAFLEREDLTERRTVADTELVLSPKTLLADYKVVKTSLEGSNLRLSFWWGTISNHVSGYEEIQLVYSPQCTNRSCRSYLQPQSENCSTCPYCRHKLSEKLSSKVIEEVQFSTALVTRFEAPIVRIEVNNNLAQAISLQANFLRKEAQKQYGDEDNLPSFLAPLFECESVYLALHSLTHLLNKSIPLLFLASDKDVSSLAQEKSVSPHSHKSVGYVWDDVNEGCGTSELIFTEWEACVSKALDLATECDCHHQGCPKCLIEHGCPQGNRDLSKSLGVWLLKQFFL